jgi:hypothetical protein
MMSEVEEVLEVEEETLEAEAEETTDENQDTDESQEESGDEPEKGKDKEPIKFDERQQKVFDDAIAKKTRKAREAERKADELAKELEEIKAKLPKEAAPEIPPVPDSFDPEFKELMAKRDDAIQKKAIYEANKTQNERALEAKEREKAEGEKAAFVADVEGYAKRSKLLGIAPEALKAAGAAVAEFGGVSGEVARYLLKEPQGPAITMYLSKNPDEIEAIRGMDTASAAVYIATEIKPKAVVKKAKADIGEPQETLKGSGLAPKDRGPQGAKFE